MNKIISRLKKNKLYNKIIKFVNFDKKYHISSLSAEVSFYMITSIVSLLLFGMQIVGNSSDVLTNFLFLGIFDIFSDTFKETIRMTVLSINLSGFNIVIFISVVFSASGILNCYNRLCDKLYENIAPRKYYINRLSSLLMFFMLLFILIFEIYFIFYSDNILMNKLNLKGAILKISRFIIEIIVIKSFIILLYIYAPPKKIKLKEVYYGSLIVSFLLCLLMRIFLIIVNIYRKINIVKSISISITMFLFLIFFVNYLIILGFFINYFLNKK